MDEGIDISRPALLSPLGAALAVSGGLLFGVILALIGALNAPPPVPAGPGREGPSINREPVRGGGAASESDAERYRRLVDFGDRCYADGVARLKQSDPLENPSGWAEANEAALDLLDRSVGYYNEALEIREEKRVVDRVRDANFKRMAARKRKLEAGARTE